MNDFRFATRQLIKNPGFTIIAVLVLALAIGANTAVLSLVNGLLLRPLPYKAPDDLVLLWERFPTQGLERIPVSAPEYLDYEKQTKSFEKIGAFNYAAYNLTTADVPERIVGAVVSPSVFSLLEVEPIRGRVFINVPATRHALFETEEPVGGIYLPFARGFQSDISYFVRFRSLAPGSEAAAADLIRRAVRDVDPSIPILSLRTFAQHLDSNLDLWLVRAGAALFSIFGALALGLAVVGLYGIKAYSVARRTREIGIRIALGAQAGAVLRMIMREGLVMLISGVAIGLLLAIATAKLLSGILYGVSALDPIAFTVAPLVLTIAALIATWLPARRATRVDPAQALRAE
jgi:FtsX-like permease family protein